MSDVVFHDFNNVMGPRQAEESEFKKKNFFFATQKNTEDVAISATHQQPIQLFTSKKKKIKSP